MATKKSQTHTAFKDSRATSLSMEQTTRVNLYYEKQVNLINTFENLHASVHPHQLLTASMLSNKVVDISQYNTTGIVVLSVLQHAAQPAK